MAQDNAGNTPEIWEPAELEEGFEELMFGIRGVSESKGLCCPECEEVNKLAVGDLPEEVTERRRLFNYVTGGPGAGALHAFEIDAYANLTGILRRGEIVKEILARAEDGEPVGWALLNPEPETESEKKVDMSHGVIYCADCGEPAGLLEDFQREAAVREKLPPIRGGSLPEIWDAKEIQREYPNLIITALIVAGKDGLRCPPCGPDARFNCVILDPATGDLEAVEMTSSVEFTGVLRRGDAARDLLCRPEAAPGSEPPEEGPLPEDTEAAMYCAECGRGTAARKAARKEREREER